MFLKSIRMKNKTHFVTLALAVAIGLMACGGNKSDSKAAADSTTGSSPMAIPPPDNSAATNSSLADTAFHAKDSSRVKKDTVPKK